MATPTKAEDGIIVNDPDGILIGRPGGKVLMRSIMLAGFAVGKSALRPKHTKELDELGIFLRANPIPEQAKWVIRLIGRASQTGSDEDNLTLSKARIASVETYLAKKLGGLRAMFDHKPLGEADPYDGGIQENALDRSVKVQVMPAVRGGNPPPPIPPIDLADEWKKAPKLQPKTLTIRVTDYTITGLSVSLPPIPYEVAYLCLTMNFEVRDTSNGATANYHFEGVGPTTGLTIPSKVILARYASVGPGDPQKAKVHPWIRIDDLVGSGKVATLAGLPTTFSFGGKARAREVDPYLDYPRVRVNDFSLQQSLPPNLPATLQVFDGDVTRGRKVL